ncbi:MAG: hypothetical protein J0M02_13555 [Planctomycetes bacterium]|nr:hypothetical protein [Planctomycetota bacterium]
MADMQGGYDHVNKRIVLEIGEARHSIPVTVTGTKHAAVSLSAMQAKGLDAQAIDMAVYILKKYRNRNGKSFIVTVVD